MSISTQRIVALLSDWVAGRAPHGAVDWFKEQVSRLAEAATDKDIYLALGYATRRIGKADLNLTPAELAEGAAARPGWNPVDWSIDQAARAAFVLASYGGDATRFASRLEQLFITADIGELIAFYRALPLYPDPKLHVMRACEGTRSAMQPVFEAVAHRNPYAREEFDENAWNHMVLKALFIGSRLDPIQGLDERANPRLTRMLCDYAHERWAAGRPVSPELWRCVGLHVDEKALEDLAWVLRNGAPVERKAAALALNAAAGNAAAAMLLRSVPDLQSAARGGQITWTELARC